MQVQESKNQAKNVQRRESYQNQNQSNNFTSNP
jgi:hypothetical protein